MRPGISTAATWSIWASASPASAGNYAESGVLFQTENGFIGVGATAQGIEISDRLFNAGGIPYLPALGGLRL